ncbi:hypothetical protein AX16_003785 [Volvariella volvacea WC 439]|nr:hypothetical protein AX16_003785 [Volvariella volvacea WC 439]
MAIVFVAGPLSGLIMQPLIGVLADNSTSRWGRRRPYMMAGTFLCMISMLLLGFTRPVAAIFTGYDNASNDILTIWLAVLAIYFIDFSINAVQAVDRALLVDTLPTSDQAQANAWAARMLGVGSVVGFFVGGIDLPKVFPMFGKNQLQVLTVIVSLLLFAGHAIMAMMVKEKVLIADSGNGRNRKTLKQEFRDIWTNMLTLPPVIRQICFIQFFAWIGWFPVLFYTTVYVGDLHRRASPIPSTPEAEADLNTEATRLGSQALFLSSTLSLLVNLLAPAFVSEAAGSPINSHASPVHRGWKQDDGGWSLRGITAKSISRYITSCRIPKRLRIHLVTIWAISHAVFALCMFSTWFIFNVPGASIMVTITGFSWAITQWAPFSLLAEAILTEPSPSDESRAIRLSDARTARASLSIPMSPTSHSRRRSQQHSPDSELQRFLAADSGNEGHPHDDDNENDDASDDDSVEMVERRGSNALFKERQEEEDVDLDDDERSRLMVMSNSNAQISRPDVSRVGLGIGNMQDEDEYDVEESIRPPSGLSSKAGIILGIHNIFIVIPQFLVTGISSIMFALLDPNKSVLPAHNASGAASIPSNITDVSEEDVQPVVIARAFEGGDNPADSNAIVYIFRLGGIAAAIAFILCWRLARELRHR